MKRIALTLIAILLVAFPMFSQNVIIPDTAFLYALIEDGVDTNGDSLISYEEAEAINYLDVSSDGAEREHIVDMTGIEALINLDTLNCGRNQIKSLDLSNNVGLRKLDCYGNELSSLDLCNNDSIENLDIHDMPSLDTVFVSKSFPIEDVVIAGSDNVEFIVCGSTRLNPKNQSVSTKNH